MGKNGAGDLRNVDHDHLHIPTGEKLASAASHKPRILLLYGSLRARSYSRFLTMEAAREHRLVDVAARPEGLAHQDAHVRDDPAPLLAARGQTGFAAPPELETRKPVIDLLEIGGDLPPRRLA